MNYRQNHEIFALWLILMDVCLRFQRTKLQIEEKNDKENQFLLWLHSKIGLDISLTFYSKRVNIITSILVNL